MRHSHCALCFRSDDLSGASPAQRMTSQESPSLPPLGSSLERRYTFFNQRTVIHTTCNPCFNSFHHSCLCPVNICLVETEQSNGPTGTRQKLCSCPSSDFLIQKSLCRHSRSRSMNRDLTMSRKLSMVEGGASFTRRTSRAPSFDLQNSSPISRQASIDTGLTSIQGQVLYGKFTNFPTMCV